MAISAPQGRSGAGSFVLAAAVPFLFLHRHYQPSVAFGGADVNLSDVAIGAVCIAAVLTRAPVARAARAGVAVVAVLALAVFAWTTWGAHFDGYPTRTHLVTAGKFVEYMLLVPAVALIVRRPRDLMPAAYAAVAWSVVATTVGVLQFFGAVGDLDHTPPGRRKPSLLDYHDFSALSAAVLLLALLVVATGRGPRRIAIVAAVSGVLGMVIGGAFDAVLGLVLGAALILVACRVREPRRVALIIGAALAVFLGTIVIRGQAVADGLKFLGIKQGNGGASTNVQSYRQRVLLAYIGGRIFLDHPALGVGFEGSGDHFAYAPYVADAKRKFDQPAVAFPSPSHPWGVQNAYVQLLADLGVLGPLLFLAAALTPVALALRRGSRPAAIAGGALVLLALGVWNGFGIVAGIPLDALTWLGAGICLASLANATQRPPSS